MTPKRATARRTGRTGLEKATRGSSALYWRIETMQRQRMSNERLAHECQTRSVTLSNLTLADDPHGDPASAELLQGACYALTEQATRIAELEGALRDLLAEDDGEPADETGGACLYVHGDDLLSARRVLGEGSRS